MFIGHYGVSFALKSADKSIPLWLLFVAVQFLDVLWSIFIMTGIEKVRIVPGITATNPLDLYYMPYTHSLVGALVWSAVAFAIYKFGRKSLTNTALWVGAAVFSHWLLDLIVHRPDLALYDDSYKIGFGLWNYPAIAFALEIVLLFGGMIIYLRSTTANSAVGRYGMPVFGIVLILVQSYVFFGPTLSSPAAAALIAITCYVAFAGIAFWLERQRSVH
jgi:membrane-bound metal-dependent hydrolase YbcI (DUF457 family)